jgi:predicted DsbA family dithiol-disulfide isomerase
VKEYDGKLRVVYKNMVVHPQVRPAHLAGCAAAKQGKFVEWKRDWWEKAFKTRNMSPENIDAIASGIGVDMAKFKKDMASDDCAKRIDADMAELNKFHVGSTPSFFINGQAFFAGAAPKETFKSIIDDRLKVAEASGVACGDYYEKEIMGKGEKTFRSKKDPKPH